MFIRFFITFFITGLAFSNATVCPVWMACCVKADLYTKVSFVFFVWMRTWVKVRVLKPFKDWILATEATASGDQFQLRSLCCSSLNGEYISQARYSVVASRASSVCFRRLAVWGLWVTLRLRGLEYLSPTVLLSYGFSPDDKISLCRDNLLG